jgi:short-subunit dehydrogenase
MRSGTDMNQLPAAMLMDVQDMVDAALRGLDLGESVTIPSLPELAEWDNLNQLRQALAPRLSLSSPAARYQV